MLTIPTDRRQEGLPADMLHAVRPCRFATHRLSYRRAAAGHALWLRNYWSALRKMPLVAFEGAGVRQVPVLRPVLHVDGVAGLGLYGHDDPRFRSPPVPFGCSVRSAAAAGSTYYRKS